MKNITLLFCLVFIFLGCNDDDKQLVEDIHMQFPGSWEILELYNNTEEDYIFKNNTYPKNFYIESLGSISIPDFQLEKKESNLIVMTPESYLTCLLKFDNLDYPFFLSNFSLSNGDQEKMQCQFAPLLNDWPINKDLEFESLVSTLMGFDSFYKIELITNDLIHLYSDQNETKLAIVLKRL